MPRCRTTSCSAGRVALFMASRTASHVVFGAFGGSHRSDWRGVLDRHASSELEFASLRTVGDELRHGRVARAHGFHRRNIAPAAYNPHGARQSDPGIV